MLRIAALCLAALAGTSSSATARPVVKTFLDRAQWEAAAGSPDWQVDFNDIANSTNGATAPGGTIDLGPLVVSKVQLAGSPQQGWAIQVPPASFPQFAVDGTAFLDLVPVQPFTQPPRPPSDAEVSIDLLFDTPVLAWGADWASGGFQAGYLDPVSSSGTAAIFYPSGGFFGFVAFSLLGCALAGLLLVRRLRSSGRHVGPEDRSRSAGWIVAALLLATFTCMPTLLRAQVITTFAGSGAYGSGGNGGPATAAQFSLPNDVAVHPGGWVFIADEDNNLVRRVDIATGIITIAAGNGTDACGPDGVLATATGLRMPADVAVDAAGGLLIVERFCHRIRRVDPVTSLITTVAGNGTQGFGGDGGPAVAAKLNNPHGIWVDTRGNLFIADGNNERIRRVDRVTGKITTVAGNGTPGFNGDGIPATQAQLNFPKDVAVDRVGNIFIADSLNYRVRRVAAGQNPIITTLAGTGTPGFSGDGGPGIVAQIGRPDGIAADLAGNLHFADFDNSVIRQIAAGSGVITRAAGTGVPGYAGDGGDPLAARLKYPSGVALDGRGGFFIADRANRVIRRVSIPSCSDAVKNGRETDVDCGGASSCSCPPGTPWWACHWRGVQTCLDRACPACQTGQKCRSGGDCASSKCPPSNPIACILARVCNGVCAP